MTHSRFQWRTWALRLWNWSPLVTLPFVIFVGFWLTTTLKSYSAFGIRYDSSPFQAKLRVIGNSELSHLRSKFAVALRPASPSTDLRTIDLFLGESDEAKLNKRLPYSGREYVPGHLLYPNGKSHRVEVRYRGDFVQHWGPFKKSLRIKTRKSRLFDGMRKLNIITPKFEETLNNHLSYALARELGLIAPRSEMVNLRINGGYRGVYVLVEQLEELTLRHQSKMPGDIYSGEILARDKYYGVRNRLTEASAFWEKIAVNNHFPEESTAPLETFLDLVRRSPEPTISDSWDYVDIDAWGRFYAHEILLQTFHYSNVHNWRLYYDPWRQRMSPVVWDPDGWHPQWRRSLGGEVRLDVVTNDFHLALLKNQAILLARDQALRHFFKSGKDQRFLAEVDRVATATRASLAIDPNVSFNFRHAPPGQALKSMERLRQAIHSTLQQVREGYLDRYGKVSWMAGDDPAEVRFAIEGRRPVDAIELRTNLRPELPERTELVAQVGSELVTVDVSGAVSLNQEMLRVEVPLFARHVIRKTDVRYPLNQHIEVLAGHVSLRFHPPLPGTLAEVRVERAGRFDLATEEKIGEARSYPDGTVLTSHRPVRKPLRWSGDVHLEGMLVIEEDVLVEPGTTVHLGSGATVILKGRLVANGQPLLPIRFVLEEGTKGPWGALALQGRGADGSLLRHCYLEGGSGYKEDLMEYSAMLSIHDVRDVIVEDCHFRNSHVVDDMVHAVYSEVRFVRSRFEGAPFDALDLDISTAVVEQCEFSRVGNDAIDLMETEAVVLDSRLSASGDKGISVGEGSSLWAINNIIEGTQIGVEAKDGSIAVLANTTLRRNRQALHAYQKNWRYGTGGTIRLLKSSVQNHEKPIEMKARSWLWVYDSSIDESLAGSKRMEVDATVDREMRIKARVAREVHVPDASWGASDFLMPYWTRVDTSRRGAEEFAP